MCHAKGCEDLKETRKIWFLWPRSLESDGRGSVSLALSRKVSGAAGVQAEKGSHCKVRGGRDGENTVAAKRQDFVAG